jgi:hypothetical protein
MVNKFRSRLNRILRLWDEDDYETKTIMRRRLRQKSHHQTINVFAKEFQYHNSKDYIKHYLL